MLKKMKELKPLSKRLDKSALRTIKGGLASETKEPTSKTGANGADACTCAC